MKKAVSVITLLFAFCLSTSGCSYNSLLFDENCEIVIGPLKNEFIDGTYYAVCAYYNNEGYAGAMKSVVKNNVITEISFDYIDSNGNRYSKTTTTEMQVSVAQLKSASKNLTGVVLAEQSYLNIRDISDDYISKDYLSLITALFPKMEQGNTDIAVLNKAETYTAVSDKSFLGYTPILTVEYIDSQVNRINFSLIDSEGASLTSSNFPQDTAPESNLTYADILKHINSLPEDKKTLYKQSLSAEWGFLYSLYNPLTNLIQQKHRLCGVDITSIL